MPFISANILLSADGKITTRGGGASGFGSKADHRNLLALRADADAILVGRKTLLADAMTMGLGPDEEEVCAARRADGKAAYPARCIASFSGSLPDSLPLFRRRGGEIHVFHGAHAGHGYPEGVVSHAMDCRARLCQTILRQAEAAGWWHIHCEGGPGVLRHFLERNLVDRLHITITPRLFGGHSAPCLSRLLPGFPFQTSRHFFLAARRQEEGDWFFTYEKVAR